MDPNLECLDINCSAAELAEYIDRFNICIDIRGTCDEKAINGAILMAFGEETFILLRN